MANRDAHKDDWKLFTFLIMKPDQSRFMNADVMVVVLKFMREAGLLTTKESTFVANWNKNVNYPTMEPYLLEVLPAQNSTAEGKKYSNEEYQVITLRMAATFIRYIRYFIQVWISSEEEYRELPIEEESSNRRPEDIAV
jgi:hypothetical protein